MRNCDTSSLGQLVGAVFVHTQCRGQDTTAHQRNACQFKKPLHRPVLAVASMQNRESGIQRNLLYASACLNQKSMGILVKGYQGRGAIVRIIPGIRLNFFHRAGEVIPISCGGNSNQYRVIPCLIHVRDNCVG